jgi:hypothetical protein
MSPRTDILSRFSDKAPEHPLFVPDLTLWYATHKSRGTLPERWEGHTLPQVARNLGLPIWLTVAPRRRYTPGVEIRTLQDETERVIQTETSAGTLRARWTLGPDGDWWQTEYPVKTQDDLAAVLEAARARSYVLESAELERSRALAGDDGVVALELPRRPYSDVLHEFLGWSDGLMFLGEPEIIETIAALDRSLQSFVEEVAPLSCDLVLSPDNLDGQFISPRAFRNHLADSYRQTAELLHQHGKRLVVHVGGPIKRLLALLAEAGVDGFEGIAGPPQSDLTLAEARELVSPVTVLWGGIPQDFLLRTRDDEELTVAVSQAVRDSRRDGRIILGVADRVPVDAEIGRLETIPAMIDRFHDS